jgi:hypothetical protein
MEDDMRSTAGAFDDGTLSGLAHNADVAYNTAIPKETVARLLKQCICCVGTDDQPENVRTLSFSQGEDVTGYYSNNRREIIQFFNDSIRPELERGMVILTCDDCEDASMDTAPLPLFLVACQVVLMAHAMGCEMVVGLPSSQMGCPGTSLSLRHALRCMMRDPENPSNQCSAHGVAELFCQVHDSLVR